MAFIATLLDSNVRFKSADLPQADRTFLQMRAVFAEYERERISERTRAALAAATARGAKLGGPLKGAAAGRLGAARNRERAAAFAANILRSFGSSRSAALTHSGRSPPPLSGGAF